MNKIGKFIAGGAVALGLTAPAIAEQVGEVSVDWVGNDIVIEAVQDPKVNGVTCHIAYFDRSVIDRLSQGNWFEDPSNSAIECTRTGLIDVSDIDTDDSGEEVFSAGRSLVLKSIRVKRIYDQANNVLIYLAHARELSEGSAKMAISTVALTEEDMAQPAN